ncbi:hypothetical protein [Microbulbifer agarilyticus]
MRELTEGEVTELQWGDAEFTGYYWDSELKDPALVVRVKPSKSTLQELICFWATNLNLNLNYLDQVGSLRTWAVAFEILPEGRWRVLFDFAGQGSVEFECNSLAIRSANGA